MGKGRLTANPPNVPGPVGMYSHIARVDAGELLFLAGQVAVDENGEVLAKDDAGAQTRIAYERVGAILADAGGDVPRHRAGAHLSRRHGEPPILSR